ncbi:MAG: hypothetical protein CAK85_00365 [Spartobacteria bacterium AMD-G5]|nr:MAG: hypothetical protein CAK85_00365 [Spartobacteria bacterium AMD-G5]
MIPLPNSLLFLARFIRFSHKYLPSSTTKQTSLRHRNRLAKRSFIDAGSFVSSDRRMNPAD